MYSIRKAYKDDFEKVYPLFTYFNNNKVEREQWQRLFSPVCSTLNNTSVGFILENNETAEVVGFLGCLLSKRTIKGKEYIICSYSSWVVKPELRKKNMSTLLMDATIAMKDWHLQVLSPIKKMLPLYHNYGFKTNTSRFTIIIPYPFTLHFSYNNQLFINTESIISYLNTTDVQIYNDHQYPNCHHILIKYKKNFSYLVMKPALFSVRVFNSSKIWVFANKVWYKLFKKDIIKGQVRLGMVHYISNPEVFNKCIGSHIKTICKAFGIKGLHINRKYITKQRFNYIADAVTELGIIRSNAIESDDLDTLYSDLILFELDL